MTEAAELTRDGHTLRIEQLGDEGWPNLVVDCPGPGRCEAHWQEPDETWTTADREAQERHRAEEPCWLRYWFAFDSAEAREGIKGRAEGSGPYELGWSWNGEWVELLIGDALG